MTRQWNIRIFGFARVKIPFTDTRDYLSSTFRSCGAFGTLKVAQNELCFFHTIFSIVLCVGVTFVGEWGLGEQGGSILVFVGRTKRTKRMVPPLSAFRHEKVLQGMRGTGVYLGIKQSIPHRKTVPLFVEPDLGSKCKANSDDDNLGLKG
jgi:hypothetical protein